MTTLLSALTAVANNPVVKRLGKKAAKQVVDKAADFAKSKVSNPLGREAIDAAEAAAKKMIGDGRRMHGMGHSGGVRLSGRGHCSGSGMRAVHGSGMRAVGHRRGSRMEHQNRSCHLKNPLKRPSRRQNLRLADREKKVRPNHKNVCTRKSNNVQLRLTSRNCPTL